MAEVDRLSTCRTVLYCKLLVPFQHAACKALCSKGQSTFRDNHLNLRVHAPHCKSLTVSRANLRGSHNFTLTMMFTKMPVPLRA